MSSTITARRLLRGNQIVEYPLVTVDDGHITSIESRENAAGDDSVYGFPGAILVPAYLNIHVHGAVGYDVMEGTAEALHAVGAALASHGVGGITPPPSRHRQRKPCAPWT